MNSGFRNILVRMLIATVMVMGLVNAAYSQKDSITYNSTCSNYKIHFSSTIFSSIEFPDKVFWKFGDPASGYYDSAATQLPTHLYSAPGNYMVKLTVVLSGDTTRLEDTVRIVNPVSYNFGPDIFLCENGDTTITGPVVPGAVYLWNDKDSTKTDSLHIKETGVYTLQIDGCAVTDSIGVFFSDKPKIKLGDDHVLCAGEILTLNASTQNGNYSWTLNGSALPDTTGQLPVVAPGGQYIARVTVPGCGVFSDTASITFGSLAAPPFSLGPDTLLCPKQVYPLIASVAGATAYHWSTNATDSMINVTNPGIYWAFVTVSGQCEVVDSVEVTYRGDKNLDFHDTAICKGSTLVLNADFGTGTYNWTSDPPQRNDQNQTGQSTYFVYEPGLYSVVASVGNCVYTDSLHVSFNDSLMLDIGRDTSLCIGEEYLLHVKTNANIFSWQDGSTSSSYTVNTAGTYTVIAENGCGMDTVSVKIDTRHCECDLLLPNAFTPNGDGTNETFRPLHPCKMINFTLRIYNRYGELVYQTNDQYKGWDGTYNMGKASAGTYVWTASYINTDTQQRNLKKGFVILIR
jgi:gliding motility-associated-like protein